VLVPDSELDSVVVPVRSPVVWLSVVPVNVPESVVAPESVVVPESVLAEVPVDEVDSIAPVALAPDVEDPEAVISAEDEGPAASLGPVSSELVAEAEAPDTGASLQPPSASVASTRGRARLRPSGELRYGMPCAGTSDGIRRGREVVLARAIDMVLLPHV
jgi:hypothetical protein